MILKAERIVELLEDGQKPDAKDPLVIIPTPDLSKLRDSGSGSVDLRLGTWFVTLKQARMTHLGVDDFSKISQLSETRYIPFGQKYYLHPGSFVLGVALEWICLPTEFAAYVIGKSSWGRRGLIIATATGVHPGFKGCLTLELTNVGELPIEMSPGMNICQLCIHRVEHSRTERIDRSEFVCLRRPGLRTIKMDAIARKLAGMPPESAPV